ncbi:MAG TPA: hypothetical protein VFY68_01990 [Nitrososphaeraceae archaeon]|nr:hypothetical protein [Nitrososphaeraceae archaeon]
MLTLSKGVESLNGRRIDNYDAEVLAVLLRAVMLLAVDCPSCPAYVATHIPSRRDSQLFSYLLARDY